MRIKYLPFLFLLLIAPIFAGCSSLETNLGTIAGGVFYNDGKTRVAGAWVRVYESIDPPVMVAETQVDKEARFFVTLTQGEYYVLAATSKDGMYMGPEDKVVVFRASTTRAFFSINVAAPAG